MNSSMPDMAHMALALPPDGVNPNFENPEDRRPMGIALCAIIFALMLLASIARTYSKAVITRTWGPEDWTCLVATAFVIGYTAISFDSLRQPAIGIHAWDLLVINIPKATNRELIASTTIYAVAVFTVKLSIFMLLYKLFWVHRKAKFLIYGGIGVSGLFFLTTMILTLVWCAPAPGEGTDHAVQQQTCQKNALNVTAVQAGFGALLDFYLLAIALPAIWELKTTTTRKLKAGSVFTLGLIASVLSVLNLYYRIYTYYYSKDLTWDNLDILITSTYEMNVALICACMPCFPSLLNTRFAQGLASIRSWISSSGSRSRSNLDASGGTPYVTHDDTSQKGLVVDNGIKQTSTFQLSEMRSESRGYERV